MTKTNKVIWLIITVFFSLGIATIAFPDLIFNSGHLVSGLGSDSGKNVFAYLYQVLYGHGLWFEGMNYPYGEHLVYTDAQPILSLPLSCLKTVTVGQALTIMWSGILLGFILAIVFVFLILVEFGVSPLLAMVFAGLICILSPQTFRMSGHFGLSWCCVIPMLFYWTLKFHQLPRLRYPVFIFLMGCFISFLHPYYAAVILLWVTFYATGYFIFNRDSILRRLRHVLPLFASVAGMFVFIFIVMRSTDALTDRPKTPYGLLAYCTRGEHILTSGFSPFWILVNKYFGFISVSNPDEGFTYLGLVVIIAVACRFFKGILNIKKKKNVNAVSEKELFSPVWIFTGVCGLLLAMGVPFVWKMEWIVNYLSFLRQFRTLGRFSWIFYYVFTIYGVIIIYTGFARLIRQKKPEIAYILIGASILFWSYEALGYINADRDWQKRASGYYDVFFPKADKGWVHFLQQNQLKPGDFQALLTLKFMEVGTDKIWLDGDEGMAKGFEAGLQLHLPIVDAMTTRSSWSVAEKQVKIAAGPYVAKPMPGELKNDRPFLLLYPDNEPLDPDQGYLLEASDSIGHFRDCFVYACYPRRIAKNDLKYADSIKNLSSALQPGDTCLKGTGSWYVNHFDEGRITRVFFGKGAMPQIMKHDTALLHIPVKPAIDNQLYEFSCWFLLGDENYKSPYFKLSLTDAKGSEIKSTDVLTKKSCDNHGLWFRASLFLTIPAACTDIKCTLYNDPDNAYKVMDELMLRPADALIISKTGEGEIMANDHLMTPMKK